MTVVDLDVMLRAALSAADAGGRLVREAFGESRGLTAKGPGDWVTETDLASETVIREVLGREAPGVPVLGEEQGGESGPIGWLVDPLDGTTNFVHGLPVVGVSIALVAHGVPIVGVVHDPLRADVYAACQDRGAFCNGRRLRVASRSCDEAIVATGFPFRKKRELLAGYLPVFTDALATFEDLRRTGAASLDLAWTAAGVLDGYFEERLGPWDVAAGALLVREAGGVVTDWQGDVDEWLVSGDIVAGSPEVHAQLLRVIAGAGPAGGGAGD